MTQRIPASAPEGLPADGGTVDPARTGTVEAMDRSDMRRSARSATLVWASIYPFQKFVQLGSNVVLAALLSPALFGIITLANVVAQGMKMFSEIGISASVVQNKRSDPEFLDSAWTLQVVRGTVLWMLIAAAAIPAAIFYRTPILVLVLPAIGLTTLANGFISTRHAVLNRQLRQGRLALLELATSVGSRLIMIVWAVVSPSVWAIVAGMVIGAVANAFATHHVLPGHRNRFCWEPEAVRSIFRFGVWVALGTMIAFFGQQLDRLMIGRLEDLGVLGVYGIAMTFARLPREAFAIISSKIVFPSVSELARTDRDALERTLKRARATVLPIGIAGTVGVAAVSPWIFRLLYDPEYGAAGWIAPLGAMLLWIELANGMANRTLLALGETRLLAMSGLLKVGVGGVAAVIGFRHFGVAGLMVGMSIGGLAEHTCDLIMLHRRRVRLIADELLYGMAVAAAMAPIGYVLLTTPDNAGMLIGAGAISVLATGAWAASKALPILLERRASKGGTPA
ncbi:MAG: oligosaccharide flippase family protein [Phycisphaerales bacterium]